MEALILQEKNPVRYTVDHMDNTKVNLDIITCLIRVICQGMFERTSGAILVFLPGIFEIYKLYSMLEDEFDTGNPLALNSLAPRITLYTLHGKLAKDEQAKVFEPPRLGTRKVVLSTNVAETGLTIPDIVFVIDSGKSREIRYDPKKNMRKLTNVTISIANAKQRRGRAGRTQPGHCFHLISLQRFLKLPGHRPPEALRLPLEEVILVLAPEKDPIIEILEQMVDPPPRRNIIASLDQLRVVGAIDLLGNITNVGKFLLKLPIDVKLGKILLYGILLQCIDPLITICAIFSLGIQISSSSRGTKLAHGKLNSSAYSDHISWILKFNSWLKLKNEGKPSKVLESYCRSLDLNGNQMEAIRQTRLDLMKTIRSSSRSVPQLDFVSLNKYSCNFEMVIAAISAGLYPNILVKPYKTTQLILPQQEGVQVRLNQTSQLSHYQKLHPEPMICSFGTIQLSPFAGRQEATVWDLSKTSPLVYIILGGNTVEFNPIARKLEIDARITFHCSAKTGSLLLSLRRIFKQKESTFDIGSQTEFPELEVLVNLLRK